jgi:predicted small lipoprotein YifL
MTGRNALRTVALCALVAAAACSSGPSEFPAADFTLKSPLTGKETSFAAYRGRPVILYWFTSW